MTSPTGSVTGGVDAHTDTHDAAALDERGRLLGVRTFQGTPEGNRALLAWLEAFGPIAVIGVESTGSYAAVRYLRSRQLGVVEVNRPHAHARRRRGKSDPIDAELAARQALAGRATVIPKRTDGTVEAIRQLRLARDSAVKARTAAFNQLTELAVTAPDELRQHLRQRRTSRGRATLCARLRPDLDRLHEPRRTAEGKTKPEIIRCLKRYIAREVFHALSADLADLALPTPLAAPTPPAPETVLTINCGAGPIGRTRRRT